MHTDYTAIKKFCMRHRRHFILAKVANAWLMLLGILFGIGTAATIAFAFFPWTALPVLFDAAVIGTGLLCLSVVVYWTVIHSPSLYTIATLLEERVARKHHYLSIALELGRTISAGSAQLVEQVCAVACRSFDIYPKRIAGIIAGKRVVLSGITLCTFIGVTVVSTPRMLSWWDLPLSLFSKVSATVYPGTIAVPKYAQVILSCVPPEAVYPSATLTIVDRSYAGAYKSKYLLRPDMNGSFSHTLDSLASSCVYYFTLGNATFGPETVTVVPPPLLYSLQVTLIPPAYTGRRETQLQEGQGAIAAYAGSRAVFSIGSLFPLRAAQYIHERGDTVPFTIAKGRAQGEVTLRHEGRYTFTLEDSMAQASDSLPSFYISILPDYEPNVRIVKPGVNKMLAPAQQETLWVEAIDDFGIRSLDLSWRVSRDETDTVYTRDILQKGKRKKLIRRQLAWDLTELSLYPGDTVFYWVRTRDTRPYGPPQVCVSDTFFFRLPTFGEMHDHIAGREDDAENALSSVQKLQKDMKERLEDLIKSSKGNKSLSWEDKKIVEDLGENLQEQTDSLNSAIKALKEAVEKMRESSVSEDILDKMNEVQKTLQKLVEEYGDSLLFQKPEPDEKLRWQDMKQAIDKMADMLPDLNEQLDNALKYLAMLKKENERALLAQQARKLAQQQMQIAQSKDTEEQRMRMQQELSKQTEEFLDDLADKLRDNSPVKPGDIPSTRQVGKLQKAMGRQLASRQIPSGGMMNQMSAGLQSMAEELEATLSSTMAAKAMKDRDMLLDMAQDGLNLSQWQDGLHESMRGSIDKKLSAAEQQALKDALRTSMKKLDSLEVVPPALLQKIKHDADKVHSAMNRALQALDSRRPGTGMQQSVQGLNALTRTLLSSANSMQQSASGQGGAGGMMCGLRKLSAKQAAINTMTAEMLRQMFSQAENKSGSGSQMGEDGERAREAAQQAQKRLADQLDELGEKYGDSAEKGLAKRVKELEEEARRIAQMLKKPTPQVSDRQDRFLVRMLQTTLSMHRQDEGKEERKSKSAVTIFSDNVKEAYNGILDKTDTFYKLRMKALDGNFPDSYRKYVQKYFETLGELFLKEK